MAAIDLTPMLGRRGPVVTTAWSTDDVILYQLGVGAGAELPSGRGLQWVYERDLRVLPTFLAQVASPASEALLMKQCPEIDLRTLVQVDHILEIADALPPSGQVESVAEVESSYPMAAGAAFVVRIDSFGADGTKVGTNRMHLYQPGGSVEAALSSDRPPRPSRPVGDPVGQFEISLLPQQGALFRLSGDRTPAHIDPDFAAAAGLPMPTLPGLCTWGVVVRQIVDGVLHGDAAAVSLARCSLSAPVFPGDVLALSVWTDEHGFVFEAAVEGREGMAIRNGLIAVRSTD